ncbi:hypothetical protein PoB_007067800 [Plakobranchus ocellatus]|uniref:Nuclear respiratory factor 1 NLS/DNA-binding dimerisation domain-containing protein n=1 Tax=Plakobranchus ocellatus TaxID=259542 RepID=A0AAV4DIX2_9GAST|nr:hypothetical protein PoB_007067800 [Plakobranchus ocellatus]
MHSQLQAQERGDSVGTVSLGPTLGMERWKELPPITLDDTTVSYLVTLIPVLVSMTSNREMPQEPRFEDETDKPEWWPSDVKWRNPKCYMQDQLEKEDRLLVLRKLVHSCYSYHGVEDLLCRLQEIPTPEDQFEIENAEEGLEVIELMDEDKQEDSATDCDAPVFVCCFCLEQFASHEDVNSHQSICKKGLKEPERVVFLEASDAKRQQISSPESLPVNSFLGQKDSSDSQPTKALDFFDTILCPGASVAPTSPVRNVTGENNSAQSQPIQVSISAAPPEPARPAAPDRPTKKPSASTSPYPFVPILKTRSQKKLDQIMLQHSRKKKMLKECQEMRSVPSKGAWWNPRKPKKISSPEHHPNTYTSQANFCASLGLMKAKAVNEEEMKKQEQQEVDLDCQIISVEGPLSAIAGLQPESNQSLQPATSPRSSKSLMSQLCRDSEDSSRRRLSFRFLEDEWADKEALEEGRDPMQMSLLSIEFSSPLGIRIRKYVSGEGTLNIVKDPEVFCKTEDIDVNYSKLRIRANDYRITYRKKRRATRFVHRYKFNRSDRYEFERLLQTGLNARSRKLQRLLTECFVCLKRLPKSEIKEWTEGKKIIFPEQIIVDDDICITQVDIPESQMKKAFLQKKNLATGYRPGPKCFASLERRPASKPSKGLGAASCSSTVPPHIPNIFRNRNSHTPSPPQPSNFDWHQSRIVTPASRHPRLKEGLQTLLAQRSADHLRSHNSCSNISRISHLSNHVKLGPSTHNQRHGWQNIAHCSASGSYHGSPSRRKQQLTHVRMDELDSSKSAQSCRNPLGQNMSSRPLVNYHETVKNHRGQHNKNSSSSAPEMGKRFSKSNPGDLRGNNGKLCPSLSHGLQPQYVSSNTSSQRQKPASGYLSTTRQHPVSGQPQNYRPSRHLPDWGSQQAFRHRVSTERVAPSKSNHLSVASSHSNVRSVSLIQEPHRSQFPLQKLKASGPQSSLLNSKHALGSSPKQGMQGTQGRQSQVIKNGARDDDILEVICIDDD